jgi:hypothetical protein
MYRKYLLCVAFFMLSGMTVFSQPNGLDLDEALNRITRNRTNQGIIRRHLGHELGNYDYQTIFDINGKYLFVFVIDPFDSNEASFSFIVDTDLVIRYPDEFIDSYSADSVFINLSDASLEQFIFEYLSQQKDFRIDRSVLRSSIRDSRFSLFYGRNGVGMYWDKGSIAARAFGPVQIILPYSRAQNYLTPVGKEAFK